MPTDNKTAMDDLIDQLLAEMQLAHPEAVDNSFEARLATLPVNNQVAWRLVNLYYGIGPHTRGEGGVDKRMAG